MRKAPIRVDIYAKNREKDGSKSSVTRLYRSSIQLAQRLDIILKSATNWQELFHAETIIIRQRLRSNCESLIFSHPKEYGRKAEEMMWRKVFYDVIQCLRQQRKGSSDDEFLVSSCRSHLLSASGYYYHLLLRLQSHFGINLKGTVSWTAYHIRAASEQGMEIDDWALRACQRCLLYLGDLARYQQEFEWDKSVKLAERFYCEAFHLNPDLGMPHNQLGTLLVSQAYGAECVYHYMRCLIAKESFEGTEGNLIRLFEKNRVLVMGMKELSLNASTAERVRRFLVYFIYLQDVLYGHQSAPKVSGDEIGQLCQSVLQDLSCALMSEMQPTPESTPQATSSPTLTNGIVENGAGKENGRIQGEVELTGGLMVKLAAIVIMAVRRLRSEAPGSPEALVATAFSLAFLSQLLQHCMTSLEKPQGDHKLSNPHHIVPQLTNGKKQPHPTTNDEQHEKLTNARRIKKIIKTRRRRRKHRDTSSSYDSCIASDSEGEETVSGDDESDLSEGGVGEDLDDDSDDDSDDVCVESDSGDDESSKDAPVLPTTIFSRYQGAHNGGDSVNNEIKNGKGALNGSSLNDAGKLLTQQIIKQNGVVQLGKVTKFESSDVSDVETECSTSSWGAKIEDLEELACVRRLFGARLLPAVKVMTDWLRINPDIVSTCVESSTSLWSKMASLLNLLPSDENLLNTASGRSYLWKQVVGRATDAAWQQALALPEDVCVLGMAPLHDAHQGMDMNWVRPPREGRCLEAIIRTKCLRSFGLHLSRNEALNTFVWDESSQQFVGPHQLAERDQQASELSKTQAANQRSKVMKAMAHQRMKSEVSKLEKALQSAPKGSTAYLVPDAPALCTQLHLIRRLVTTEKFLLIIPVQVIAALDELKKYDNGARETIKYLEAEFKRGNRWIRAQKDGESVEADRRRSRYEDVAVWRFIQVVNCCRYLTNKTGKGLVTLLTGSGSYEPPAKGQRKRAATGTQATTETVEFARTCGINVESLRAFCAKYTSTRSVT